MSTHQPLDKGALLQAVLDSRARASDYLLGHIGADGSVPQPEGRVTFYRVPWALALCGRTPDASRVLDWIVHQSIVDGEFVGVNAPSATSNMAFNTYPDTCLAVGAHLLGRYDEAERAFQRARCFQDPSTGGIYMDRQRTGQDGPQLLYLTAQYGMSAITTGHRTEAVHAGEWLHRLWHAQPDIEHRLHTVWSRQTGLRITPESGDDRRHYVNLKDEVKEFHYNGGIAAAFLSQLYLVTGQTRWIDLARAYQRFSMESTPRQFETRQVCKSAWGASELAMITRDQTYVAWAVKMANWFVSIQEPEGHWNNTHVPGVDPTVPEQIEITAEFVVHLTSLANALAVCLP